MQNSKLKIKKTRKRKKLPTVRRKRKPKEEAPLKEHLEESMSAEALAQAGKYYAGPVVQKFEEEKPFVFPAGYGDNRIVAMVRDPYWVHVYWEINDLRRSQIKEEIGETTFSRSKEFLRVYDTDNWESFDIEITGGTKNWYIKVPAPNRTYCVDIGFKTHEGKFISAARSNWVTTPLDRMSDVIDEKWMIPDWEKIYALSGGFGVGKGSEEIREMMKKRFQEEAASGWIFSPVSPVKKIGVRPFWLVANAELIVYGATEPTATLTVQGRKINLREDGTFSLRFALPDGKQVIPIEAIRDDGKQRRKITPIVERRTE